jgi:hypothetical protein
MQYSKKICLCTLQIDYSIDRMCADTVNPSCRRVDFSASYRKSEHDSSEVTFSIHSSSPEIFLSPEFRFK